MPSLAFTREESAVGGVRKYTERFKEKHLILEEKKTEYVDASGVEVQGSRWSAVWT